MMRLRVGETERATETDVTEGLRPLRRSVANPDAKPLRGCDECGKTLKEACWLPPSATLLP